MIRRFYAHNFRCLENFELPVSSHSTTLLIGKNGSGKSTIGLVLEILQRIARGENRVDDLVKPKDLARGRADVPMRFEIEIEIDGNRYEYVIAFELPAEFKALRVREEKFIFNGKPVYTRELAEVQIYKAGSRRDTTFGIDWHLVALPIVQEPSSNGSLSLFKHLLARALILRPVPSLISGISSGESMEPTPAVSNFGEWFSGIVTDAPAAYSQISRYLTQIMPDLKEIKNPSTGSDSRSLFVEFSNEIGQVSIPFKDLSDGEKCFMICALALAANDVYGPLICYWDEPDCYLAPDEVGHLIMALRQAYEAKGQLIVTSHDVEAIRRFSDDNTFVLHRRSHLEPATPYALANLHHSGDLIGALIRGEVEP